MRGSLVKGKHLRKVVYKAVAFTSLLALAGLSVSLYKNYFSKSKYEADEDLLQHSRRQLLSGGEHSCPDVQEWESAGGFVLIFGGVLYLFLGLAIVCDDFFVASLESISEALNLSEDVAGATFMAAGSSAPELFSSLTSLINPNSSDSIGIATIVGSAVFNVLVIIGVTGVFGGPLSLDWKPLVRDGFFYLVCIILLFGFFYDGEISWIDGAVLVFGYVIYVSFMAINSSVFAKLDSWTGSKKKEDDVELAEMPKAPDVAFKFQQTVKVTAIVHDFISRLRPRQARLLQTQTRNPLIFTQIKSFVSDDIPVSSSDCTPTEREDQEAKEQEQAKEEEEESNPFEYPSVGTPLDKFLWASSLPFYAMFSVTIPNCSKPAWQKWYPLTFAMSILWIGGLTYLMVDWVNRIGCILGVPAVVMGVTVLAAGTSIPDALGSIAVAKEGQGDMAVSNAIGSNVFDILVGLGVPWLITTLQRGEPIQVDKDDLFKYMAFLFIVLIIYFSIIFVNGRKLTPFSGFVLISIYGLFIIYTILSTVLSGLG
ncbi:hypothetical protein CYMTET_37735 [Cymbomonas tetramitiformis]|uniref:Sodium/calcium exchanger membrane region domain-containing protein n=1 Tax=Cymbomonas tetramitiformis TaxID=36881 RepID=A0AAE0CEV2_9CHLO|nr:hypothetical protein CYMTET_37735 [Cymbomonas tetramitiformis]